MLLRNSLNFFKGFFSSFKQHSTEYIEFELKELENTFALLLIGPLVGLPLPSAPIAMRVLPYMARELHVMWMRCRTDDFLGEVAGLFEI